MGIAQVRSFKQQCLIARRRSASPHRGKHLIQRRLVLEARLHRPGGDARAPGGRQPHPVLLAGEQAGAERLGAVGQEAQRALVVARRGRGRGRSRRGRSRRRSARAPSSRACRCRRSRAAGRPAAARRARGGRSAPACRRTAPRSSGSGAARSAGSSSTTASARARPAASGSRIGPAGNTAPVAERPLAVARLAVDHHQRQRLLHARVLVAVVHDDRPAAPAVAAAAAPAARSRATQTGRVLRQHQRLVADVGGGVRGRDRPAPGPSAARHSRASARAALARRAAEPPRQRAHHRRLAAAAHASGCRRRSPARRDRTAGALAIRRAVAAGPDPGERAAAAPGSAAPARRVARTTSAAWRASCGRQQRADQAPAPRPADRPGAPANARAARAHRGQACADRPAARRAASASAALVRATIARRRPRPSRRRCSAKLATCGPVITPTPSRAGSSGLWPPTPGAKLPPITATSASRRNRPDLAQGVGEIDVGVRRDRLAGRAPGQRPARQVGGDRRRRARDGAAR